MSDQSQKQQITKLIIYTAFERSRRVLSLFVVFDFDTEKTQKARKTKNVPLFRDFHGTFRLLVNSGGIFLQKSRKIPGRNFVFK